MNTKKITMIGCAAGMMLTGVPAFGASLLFLASEPTVPNVKDQDPGGVPVSGSALFSPGANQVTITLTNTTGLTKNAGELLTALEFTIDGLASAPVLNTATSIGRNVNAGGVVTDLGPVDLKALNTWSAGAVGTLDGINFTLDSKYGIIGAAESNGGTRYAQANSSIDGNLDNQPFAAITATFVLDIPGVTANSVIDNVMFRFGTGFQTCPSGIPNPGSGQPPGLVPLPASFWSGGVLLALSGAVRIVRRRRAGDPLAS